MKHKWNNRLPMFVMIGPAFLWMAIFVLAPLCYVVGISFLSKDSSGGVMFPLTLASYFSLWNESFLTIFSRSLLLSLQTTIICLAVGYPFAYVIANAPKKHRGLLLLLIMLPFWINSVIRIYGWNTLLRQEGVINSVLMSIGIISSPLEMLYTDGAVLLGMVYELLPFTILPLYASIEKLDRSLLEAASDLGATKPHIFTRVIFPLTMPGIFAGSIQTFIPSLGLFYISEMMGGGSTMYIGNLIKNQFLSARNWPLGAALSLLLILITLVLMKLYTKVGSLEDMA
ncbi:MAG: Spermidine Putrescine transporter permease component PotB [Oscillospiraceae bacterium]|nr:Spermidine Putrescine transporter permease component PotB [Oscillospiraceae bacterium]